MAGGPRAAGRCRPASRRWTRSTSRACSATAVSLRCTSGAETTTTSSRRDGGQHSDDPGSGCGDCDAWFADMAQADRVVQFLPRRQPAISPKGVFGIVRSDGSAYPNAGDDGSKPFAALAEEDELQSTRRSCRPMRRPTSICRLSAAHPDAGHRSAAARRRRHRRRTGARRHGVSVRTTAITSIDDVDDWHDTARRSR